MFQDPLQHRGAHTPIIPQVAAVFFAFTIAMMLLLPFVHLTFEGEQQGRSLIFLFHTDFGLNVFAIVLLLVPIAGLILTFVAPAHWALEVAVISAIGVICVPLSILLLRREAGNPDISAHVAPGIGTYVFLVLLAVVTVAAAIEAWYERG